MKEVKLKIARNPSRAEINLSGSNPKILFTKRELLAETNSGSSLDESSKILENVVDKI